MAGLLPGADSCCDPCSGERVSVTLDELIAEQISGIYGLFNPVDYGADNLGLLDSRNAFQAAANAARLVGGTVVVPPGDFRIVATLPIYLGAGVNMSGFGGRIWISLPDGYVNPNTYVSTEIYAATGVLNQNGNLVAWTSTTQVAYSNTPWNGKTQVFTAAQGIFRDLWIDWGFGSTGVPAGVNVIEGIRPTVAEQTHYQGFNNSENAKFLNCHMQNAPGAHIEVGHDILVDGCTFIEYGDHVFYMGQDVGGTQKNYTFTNNTVKAVRTTTGVVNAADYVFATFRDALKFRANKNVTVADNQILGEGTGVVNDPGIQAITLEVNDESGAQPGDLDGVTISNNLFRVLNGIDFVGARSDGSPDYRIKNVTIEGNEILCNNQTAILFRAACDGLKIIDNDITTGTGGLAFFYGSPRWTDPIKALRFKGNRCRNSASIGIGLAGLGIDAEFSGNRFDNSVAVASITSSFNLFWVQNSSTPSVLDSVPVNTQPTSFKRLIISDNLLINWYSLMLDGGYPQWLVGTTYPYLLMSTGEQVRSVVSQGGALYVNTATVTGGVAPPAASWAVYTREAGELVLERNIRYCNGTAIGDNSQYLANLNGPTALLRMTYAVYHAFNENRNSLGQAMGYLLANVSATALSTSSKFVKLVAETLESGINTGTITGYTTMVAFDDFKFLVSGASDSYGYFFDQNGDFFLDVGQDATGNKAIRVFRDNLVSWSIQSGGHITGLVTTDPASPPASFGTFYFRNTAGKVELVALFPTGAVQQIAIEP